MRLIDADSIFKKEIEFTMEFFQYRTGTQKMTSRKTPMMTLRALQRLVMILGGKVAADFRQIVEGVFTRFQSGDLSMIEEIRSNAASSGPIHQAYRQALAQEPVGDAAGTKRTIEREEALFTIELHERYMSLHERSWALYEKSLAVHTRA